jgi:hypothetical protein
MTETTSHTSADTGPERMACARKMGRYQTRINAVLQSYVEAHSH